VKKTWVVLVVMLVMSFVEGPKQSLAQDATPPAHPNHAEKSVAINLARAINTGEMSYKRAHGIYASWEVLSASDEFTDKAMKRAAQNEPQLANQTLSSTADLIPGWRVRLTLSADGSGYDVLLESTLDKQCRYAVLTDERGLIRESGATDCSN